MPFSRTAKNVGIVVSALRARANFGKLLARVEGERGSLIVEKRGTPRAFPGVRYHGGSASGSLGGPGLQSKVLTAATNSRGIHA